MKSQTHLGTIEPVTCGAKVAALAVERGLGNEPMIMLLSFL